MKIDIISIFPEMFGAYFAESIIGKAQEKGLVSIGLHDLRKYSSFKHNQVDDTQYGGGAGMVMMIEPIHKALTDLRKKNSKVIITTAKGEPYKQSTAKKFAQFEHLIILCGRYEGIDHRVLENLVDFQVSIGNYVLTGGELAAMVISDSVIRLIPGVLGNHESPLTDSFYEDDKTIQYPIYTKPAQYNLDGKILKVPDVLLSGNHAEIEKWRKLNSKS